MAERLILVVRPTSETIIGHMYAKWIRSYRDLGPSGRRNFAWISEIGAKKGMTRPLTYLQMAHLQTARRSRRPCEGTPVRGVVAMWFRS